MAASACPDCEGIGYPATSRGASYAQLGLPQGCGQQTTLPALQERQRESLAQAGPVLLLPRLMSYVIG